MLGDVDQGEISTGEGDIARSIHEASAGSASSNLRLWEALDTGLGNPGAAISSRTGSGHQRVVSFLSDRDRG